MLTDQSKEFLGEFQALLEQTYIDHKTTSYNHPKTNGLAECIVHTVKRGPRKYDLQ